MRADLLSQRRVDHLLFHIFQGPSFIYKLHLTPSPSAKTCYRATHKRVSTFIHGVEQPQKVSCLWDEAHGSECLALRLG